MNKKLAIKGHSTRGKEVIELLEMMGGINDEGYIGTNTWKDEYYFLDNGCIHAYDWCDGIKFTIEEFLEKYPFKVGDKVFLYDNITEGCITGMEWDEDRGTVKYRVYTSDEYWCDVKELLKWNMVLTNKETDEMKLGDSKCERTHEDAIFDSIIWHLRNSVNNGKQFLSGGVCEDYFREVVKKNNENKMKNVLAELLEHIKNTSKEELEREFEEIEEWSNVGPTVEEFMDFCNKVNKKLEYPKTYEECAEKINACPIVSISYDSDEDMLYNDEADLTLLMLRKLLICRAAYWKIAGKQMGLSKPWEPNWTTFEGMPAIFRFRYNIVCDSIKNQHCLLVFPTKELRDAFYENFKDLIEQCKELL